MIVKDPDSGTFVSRLVNIDRDLVLIPNLAIHMNREANNGYKYNAQKDMLPLYGDLTAKGTFMKTAAEAAGVSEEDILAMTSSSIIEKKQASGALPKNSSPAADWMTCSAHLPR